MEQYDLILAGQKLGQVTVDRQGLYLHIRCVCSLESDIMYHLLCRGQDAEEDLGLLVPQGDRFMLEKRIPGKRLGQGSLSFRLKPRHEPLQGRFVPIRADEPFAYLRFLQESFLQVQGSDMRAMVPEKK